MNSTHSLTSDRRTSPLVGETPIHRSFRRDVERRISSLADLAVQRLCELRYGPSTYPLYCLEPRVDPVAAADDLPRVLISAGIHGDEPAGVYAALDFLERVAPEFKSDFQFTVFPCLNPSGYEANTLETRNGANLNRLFGRDADQPEIQAVENWLSRRGRHFRVTFDLHEVPPYYVGEGFTESDNPRQTYLYETLSDRGPRVGAAMIAALPKSVEVCDWPTIYQDVNDHGVVAYPEACRNPIYAEGTSLDSFLNGRYTHHSFTTETPTVWDFEKRIGTQLLYLQTALRQIRGGPPRDEIRGGRET